MTEKIELVRSGEDYFNRLLRMISESKKEIHLQTYIFQNDATGSAVANALKNAASRKVKVFLLLDAYGSASLSRKFIHDLIQHGINIRFFSPFFSRSNFYIGRRLHHKVIVADGEIALIGGINISNKYHGTESKDPWLDYAIQINSNAVAVHLQRKCRNFYLKRKRSRRNKPYILAFGGENISLRIIQNDWLKRKSEIRNAYFHEIRNAKKEIILIGSYFLPGRRLSNILKKAAKRGVTIKLILAGISDVPFVRRATCFLYSTLLRSNIELYEWNYSILHGKAAVIDGEWTTIGSFNLNHLSSYGSIEMNVEVKSTGFSGILNTELEKVIFQCERVTENTLRTRKGIFTNIINWFSYRLCRVAAIMVTYIPYK